MQRYADIQQGLSCTPYNPEANMPVLELMNRMGATYTMIGSWQIADLIVAETLSHSCLIAFFVIAYRIFHRFLTILKPDISSRFSASSEILSCGSVRG